MNTLFNQINFIFATLFVLFGVWILRFSAMNLDNLKPVANAAQDFDYSDILFRYKANKPPSYSPIVIVDLPKYCDSDGNSRKDIARELDTIFQYQPKVVGVDAYFDNNKDTSGNACLLSVIGDSSRRGKIVLSGYLDYHANKHGGYNYRQVKSFAALDSISVWGYANFVGEEFKTLRHIKPFASESGRQEFKSFSAAIIQIADSTAYEALEARRTCKDSIEYINYTKSQRQFIPHFTAQSIFNGGDTLAILKNKIVLIGCTDTTYLSDLQFTPFNRVIIGRTLPDMNGVFVHANVIQMMLARNYVSTIPLSVILILVLIINYLFTIFYFRFTESKYAEYNTPIRFIQLLSFLVLMFSKVYLLKYFNYIFDDYYFVSSFILNVDLLNLYLFIIGLLGLLVSWLYSYL